MSEATQNNLLTTNGKALTVNLDPLVYGTFAEIGAGQETARNFFQAGGAAGTIAKTISAYDMSQKVHSNSFFDMMDVVYTKSDQKEEDAQHARSNPVHTIPNLHPKHVTADVDHVIIEE